MDQEKKRLFFVLYFYFVIYLYVLWFQVLLLFTYLLSTYLARDINEDILKMVLKYFLKLRLIIILNRFFFLIWRWAVRTVHVSIVRY